MNKSLISRPASINCKIPPSKRSLQHCVAMNTKQYPLREESSQHRWHKPPQSKTTEESRKKKCSSLFLHHIPAGFLQGHSGARRSARNPGHTGTFELIAQIKRNTSSENFLNSERRVQLV